jgi:hypothetical protein
MVLVYQLLVGSVMIGTELDREDHSSIPTTTIGRGLKPLDGKTGGEKKKIWSSCVDI